ncbi:AbrB/MazE/SpoVT family DNA-binding domain-containing protein [Xenorhabdus sp. Reich]|uniref:AbrB/MazE/SpoVT family DNA-binding domain-containing protein n=2 Tax=Xenorhabdus littoralis TaxID=2582835 RepID=A0ABU4SJ08_9GAMM|nr:AbrB/MazE/SpoVT family DNA-binding domain-containing protein [Xenorhabdus sp. Reich]
MERIVKILNNRRNKTIRLFVMSEFENEDVILSKKDSKRDNWNFFLNMLDNFPVPNDFLDTNERYQDIAERDPFD